MEHHPRIDISNPLIKESKIILGSFPTWSLTKPDTNQKRIDRSKNGDIKYFYGSSKNRFWTWYQKFVDASVLKEDLDSIQKSLSENSIGITDAIISCVRKDKSALDKHLTRRTYNHQFFKLPNTNETLKFLCTSKGVMNEMLLNKSFFKLYPHLKIDEEKSNYFQTQMINEAKGDLSLVRKSFYKLIEIESGGTIECIALPSPGSPYRKLADFGFNSDNADVYLDKYLKIAFDWFN